MDSERTDVAVPEPMLDPRQSAGPGDPSAHATAEAVLEAAAAVRAADGMPQATDAATVGVILGTGLGRLATEIEDARIVDYADIPHMPAA